MYSNRKGYACDNEERVDKNSWGRRTYFDIGEAGDEGGASGGMACGCGCGEVEGRRGKKEE